MYQPLIPCAACARHVRATDRRCPFCDASLPEDHASRAAPDTARRLSRAAAFAFGLSVAGCSSTVSTRDAAPGDSASPTDSVSPRDSVVTGDVSGGTDAVTPRDDGEPFDNGGIVPPYGLSPPDAGVPDDDGGPAAEYGAPPPMDAGAPDDGGTIAPLYGKPADV